MKSLGKWTLAPLMYLYYRLLLKLSIHLKNAERLAGIEQNSLLLSRFRGVGDNVTLPLDVDVIGSTYISIGNNFHSQRGLRLHCWKTNVYNNENMLMVSDPSLFIESDVFMNRDCYISCAGSMYIGSGVVFGSNVFVTDTYHGDTSVVDMKRFSSILTFPGNVVIEDGVWIGNNVCILPGVTIGAGSIVGANSVVNSTIPPFSVAAGTPAKVKKGLRYITSKA